MSPDKDRQFSQKRIRSRRLGATRILVPAVIVFAAAVALSLPGDTTADRVAGQMVFDTGSANFVDGRGLSGPVAVALDASVVPNRLYVADQDNDRVLAWHDVTAFVSGGPADLVIGQPDALHSGCNSGGLGPASLCNPQGLAVDAGGDLYVADSGNNRVVEFNSPFTTDTTADLVFGQVGSFVTNDPNHGGLSGNSLLTPSAVAVDGAGNLYISDGGNNRVLEFNSPLTNNNTIANLVLGQGGSFVTNDMNHGGLGAGSLSDPNGIGVDAQNNLYVADTGNNRVLEFNSPVAANNTTANLVFGQAGSFLTNQANHGGLNPGSLLYPFGISLDSSGNLYVADTANNRVLEFSSPVATQNTTANLVFGQAGSFTSDDFNSGGIGPGTLAWPFGVGVDGAGNVYIADLGNNRVLQYQNPASSGTMADQVLGQYVFDTGSANLVDAQGLSGPIAVALDTSVSPNRLYVADRDNNRVLAWHDVSAFVSGAPADLVIGQSDALHSGCSGAAGSASLCAPQGIAVDGNGNLYVADSGSNRVLEFNSPFTTDTKADLVFGQAGSFTTNDANHGGLGANSLEAPSGVAVDAAGNLYVADTANNRVLEFNTPVSNGNTTADLVFGQAGGFITNDANHGGLGANSLAAPSGVAVDAAGNLYVADTANNRVLEFNTPVGSGNLTADVVFGQSGGFITNDANHGGLGANSLAAPSGVAVDTAGNIYIPDTGNNRVVEFNSPLTADTTADLVFGQSGSLTTNDANHGGLGANSLCAPHAAGLDNNGNLYVADLGNNRVLEFDTPVAVTGPSVTPTMTPTPVGGASATPGPTPFPTPSAAPTVVGSRSIVAENALPGTSAWQLTNPAPNHEIEGYASLTSVNRGGQIKLFVNTIDSSYTLQVFRMGWYGGLGARQMTPPIVLAGTAQPIPVPDPTTGLVECHWSNPYMLTIANPSDPTDWVSGVYVVKLTGQESQAQSYIIFVVRDDARNSDLLFQTSVTSYQAYNIWGGKSLYGTSLSGLEAYSEDRAYKVSFNRPYYNGNGSGDFLRWEYTMLRYLESQGYDLSYNTDVDTHENGAALLNHHAFLSVGHDEYWSYEMRQNAIAARDHGVNLAFFSADSMDWQIRFEPDADGDPDRTEVCYKVGAQIQGNPPVPASLDPASSSPSTYYLLTTLFGFPHVTLPGNPEETTIGVMHIGGGNVDMVINDASDWVFNQTGLHNGDHLTGLVGEEMDGMHGFSPPGTVDLAHSPFLQAGTTTTAYADMTRYVAASCANVFAAGTFQWGWGLDNWYTNSQFDPSLVNAAAQQITNNLLGAFINPSPVAVCPQGLAFGNQVIGTASTMQNLTMHNNQGVALSIALAMGGANSGDFTIAANTCSSSLAANSQCTVSVAFAPTAVGSRTATVTINDSPDLLSPYVISLSGTGVPAVAVNPTSLWFARQIAGTTAAPRTITVTNNQSTAMSFGAAIGGSNAANFAIVTSSCATSLAANASCAMTVNFTPGAIGSYAATLSITGSPDASGPQIVSLGGSSVLPVDVEPTSVWFGTAAVGGSAAKTVTITNGQGTAVSISPSIGGGNAADFAIASTTCGASIAANSACTISVSFTPAVAGGRAATLTITDSPDPYAPHNIPLSGNAVVPVTVSAASLWFPGGPTVGSTSAAQSVVVINNQSVALGLSLSIGGTNPTDFAIASATTCGATLAAKSQCTVAVAATPTAAGARAATLTIADSPDLGSPHNVALATNAVAPATVSPASLWFPGGPVVGSTSAAQSVVVINNQSVALGLSLSIGGTNPTDFAIASASTCGATLAAKSQCTVAVAATPTAAGARAATLTIADSPDLGSPHNVALATNAVAPATVSPASLWFPGGPVVGSTSAAQSVVVINNQSVALGLSLSIGGTNPTDFAIASATTCGATLAAKSQCTVAVAATPTAAGARAATLTIADSPDLGSPHNVALATNAVASVTVSPASLWFPGGPVVGSTSAAQSVVVINNQSVALGLSLSIGGTNPTDFAIASASTCGATLAAKSQCTVAVAATPTAAGARAATLTIADSPDLGSPHNVALATNALAP